MKDRITLTQPQLGTLAISALTMCAPTWASDDAMSCVKDIAMPGAYSTLLVKYGP